MEKRIAIFHWGEITVHAYYLAAELKQHHIEIDFFLYTPTYANKIAHLKNLILKLGRITNLVEIKCSSLETYIIKIHRLIALAGPYLPSLFTNPFLPFRTRRKFNSSDYHLVITIAQSSLYWLYKTDAEALHKTLHYSLEIEKIDDPNLVNHPLQLVIIREETRLMNHIAGLIIQDKLRAHALITNKELLSSLNLIYFPVSIPGQVISDNGHYLHRRFGIAKEKQILLYFGAVFQERKIDELVSSFESRINDDIVLVVHGPGNFAHISNSKRVIISNDLLDYGELHNIISSAYIGVAFYDNSWPNTRLTAFSSEKIARYTQAGIPFLALRNESYIKLKDEFDCCELIDDVDDLNVAIDRIINNYQYYRTNAYHAYNKYYNISNSIMPLVTFINSW